MQDDDLKRIATALEETNRILKVMQTTLDTIAGHLKPSPTYSYKYLDVIPTCSLCGGGHYEFTCPKAIEQNRAAPKF